MSFKPDLYPGAFKLVNECAMVDSEDEVLIVTDTYSVRFADAIMSAVMPITRKVNTVVMPMYGRLHSQDPTAAVARAMSGATIVFMPTMWSMSHTSAVQAARTSGVRCIAIPAVDDETFARSIPEAPFGEVKQPIMILNQMMSEANEAEFTTKAGTNMWVSLKGRNNYDLEHGWLHKGKPEYKSNFAAPPCVESNIAPIEGSAYGKMVVDLEQSVVGLIKDPITLTVENGAIVKIEGKTEADDLRTRLEEAKDPNIYKIAEMGFGMNPKAKIRGNFLEDESVLGTGHFGIGNNYSILGGEQKSNGHFDNIMWYPTLKLDGVEIMKDGKFVTSHIPPMTGLYLK